MRSLPRSSRKNFHAMNMEEVLSGAGHSVLREMAEEDNHRVELHPDDLIESEDDDEDMIEGMESLKMGEGSAPSRPPPRIRSKGNTGPKGVLADYAEAKERQQLKREAQTLSFNLEMHSKAVSYIRPSATEEDKDKADDSDEVRP